MVLARWKLQRKRALTEIRSRHSAEGRRQRGDVSFGKRVTRHGLRKSGRRARVGRAARWEAEIERHRDRNDTRHKERRKLQEEKGRSEATKADRRRREGAKESEEAKRRRRLGDEDGEGKRNVREGRGGKCRSPAEFSSLEAPHAVYPLPLACSDSSLDFQVRHQLFFFHTS